MIIVSSIDDSYKKIKKLGQGGFAEVYLVRVKKGIYKNKIMALKILFARPHLNMIHVLFPKSSFEQRSKFYNTQMKKSLGKILKIMSDLNKTGNRKDIISYKHIIFDKQTGNYAILLSYVPGITLNELRSLPSGAQNEKFLFFLAKNILCTLDYLHNKNVVHRDIKPDNIIYNSKTKQITLIDFGLACFTNNKISWPKLSKCHYAGGTPNYIHPRIDENWDNQYISWEKENWKGNDIYGFVVTIKKIASRLKIKKQQVPWLKDLENEVLSEDLDKIPSAKYLLQKLGDKCGKNGKST